MSSLNSIGTFLLACWTGSTDGSNLMSYSPSKASSQLNDFGHSLWRSLTLVTVTELVCGRQILTWWWKYLCTIGFNGLFWVFSTLEVIFSIDGVNFGIFRHIVLSFWLFSCFFSLFPAERSKFCTVFFVSEWWCTWSWKDWVPVSFLLQ